MANLIRCTKSGNDWTTNELAAYNISITPQDVTAFFGLTALPEPHVPADMLQKLEADDADDLDACRTIAAMDLTMNPVPAEETAVDDFTVRLFDMLGYTTRDISLRTRKDIPLVICGESRRAKTDVCLLMNRSEIILLVQGDKRNKDEGGDPEAQLIAEAIATFQSNNKKRVFAGVPVRDACLIPGIVMTGTAPTFYKILVTKNLADAVAFGIFPPHPTVVHRHVPSVPRPMRRLTEGMKPLDNRAIVLRCFEGFKKFIPPQ
ncbi:uncharacterized protein EV420DRAFT_1641057 [Desarmillaria tabescens]|uniref:Uncharacterized protein n=1 Tax=Armillaria tabescens TaxID=1929756 RepID=A0AA39N7L4_ARMTA|nr:uncharacterized protein EV420DRAFT_1641057 [Desarmillaria tabescens]KAK0460509.1 hypothetical protein EV420DRAFT_1641057 [Desarmillaria tabescens]